MVSMLFLYLLKLQTSVNYFKQSLNMWNPFIVNILYIEFLISRLYENRNKAIFKWRNHDRVER